MVGMGKVYEKGVTNREKKSTQQRTKQDVGG